MCVRAQQLINLHLLYSVPPLSFWYFEICAANSIRTFLVLLSRGVGGWKRRGQRWVVFSLPECLHDSEYISLEVQK